MTSIFNNYNRYRLYELTLLFILFFCQAYSQQPTIYADSLTLRNHVSALANDSMKGRGSGTPDEQRAASYIESYFAKINLKPKGDSGTYQQQVTLPTGKIYSSSTIIIHNDTLSFPSDFSIYQTPAVFKEFKEGLIFVGYGIHSDDQRYDSYHDIVVKNKIVVALSSHLWDRAKLPKDFKANHESQVTWAKERGAAGLLLLNDSPSKRTNCKKSDRNVAAELFQVIDKEGFLWLEIADGSAFVRKIFQIENLVNISLAYHASSNVTLRENIVSEQTFSSNVIGKIQGSDLGEEYIVITAHYDHLGVGRNIDGDSIYNGTLDNASGVSVLLETARLFATSSVKPRRSILFIALGAEEQGFYGSKYFVAHPTVPLNAIVANINIDVAGFAFGSPDCWMTLLGEEYNDMGEKFEESAEELGIHLMPNVMPSYYRRSDGYIFAQAGIPSLSPASGMPLNKVKDGMNHFLKFYHQRNDEIDKTPINFSVLRLQTQAITNGVWQIANSDSRPEWTSELDSESWMTVREIFGQIRVWFAGLF